jgi:hypothetical protein
MGAIEEFERAQLRKDIPVFKSGDTLRVHSKWSRKPGADPGLPRLLYPQTGPRRT